MQRKLGIGGGAMNKEEILKMSRAENEGKRDEREIMVSGMAAKIGMAVGILICTLLVLASELLLKIPEVGLAGWLVYFSMYGASNLAMYKELKNRRNLEWGIITTAAAVVFAVMLIVKSVV